MTIKYVVDGCHDDQGALRDTLHRISEEGSRVVSVTWQPSRTSGNSTISAGYTIVSEVDADA